MCLPRTFLQCADLTLSTNATIDSSASCANSTGETVQTLSSQPVMPTGSATTGTTPTPSGTSPASTSSSAAFTTSVVGLSSLLSLADDIQCTVNSALRDKWVSSFSNCGLVAIAHTLIRLGWSALPGRGAATCKSEVTPGIVLM